MPPGRADTDSPESLYLGIDFGTSGCRALAIDAAGEIHAQADTPIPAPRQQGQEVTQDPRDWWRALIATLQNLFAQIDRKQIRALAVDGTSATLLLCDVRGEPLTPALLYNDRRASSQAARIATVAPAESAAHGITGSLAKLLWLMEAGHTGGAIHALHQADWIAGRLTGRFGHSDYNNCLKLGYDAERLVWPDWLAGLGIRKEWLPQVHAPGTHLGRVRADVAHDLGLPAQAQVVAGTTDGVAAFLAAGAQAPGEGVTSLGSTLVLKLLSDRPVSSPKHGVYSHRLGRGWLAGGASNSGGAALAKFFSPEQLRTLTPMLKPEAPTGLDYYPLPAPGERFPINDPLLPPRLEPRPPDDTVFLQGMLEGIARIETQGYALLAQLGAPKLKAVFTTGGGAQNAAWEHIRARQLGVPLRHARSEQAAYGTALLAAGLAADIFGFEN
ncbi:MAG: carbohydrate kinase [Gammaproteobacteria bacterium]|nr:MAG: carbohydrate kinase [Gammaproteobacteria bacterium]